MSENLIKLKIKSFVAIAAGGKVEDFMLRSHGHVEIGTIKSQM